MPVKLIRDLSFFSNEKIETVILNEKNNSLRNLKCKFMAHFMPHLGM